MSYKIQTVTVSRNTKSERPFSWNCLDFLENVFHLRDFPLSSVQTSKSEEEIFEELNLDLKPHVTGFQNIHSILRHINCPYAHHKKNRGDECRIYQKLDQGGNIRNVSKTFFFPVNVICSRYKYLLHSRLWKPGMQYFSSLQVAHEVSLQRHTRQTFNDHLWEAAI